MISQDHITPETPMGANLVAGGATFRVWAPAAVEVYLNGRFGGTDASTQTPEWLMAKDASGYWTGFAAGAVEGDRYKFYVIGMGSRGYKRDPYARELADGNPSYPHCYCLVRSPETYPWHDAGFHIPDFSDMIVYQLHIGTFAPRAFGETSTFLDVAAKIEHLAALGVNVLQPLPIDELETSPSLGYNGSDYCSPDLAYIVHDAGVLSGYLGTVNRLLTAKGGAPLTFEQLRAGPNQLKALVDLCHLYGIAVVFDVVYNHAGGFFGDDEALYFWDRQVDGDPNHSLYFTDRGWAGGLSFALWNNDVRQFLVNTARFYIDEFHVDGLRYDEVSAIVSLNGDAGWSFCRDITATLRHVKRRVVQNAEFWPVDSRVVTPAAQGGAGFDVVQHDGLRRSIRNAIKQCSYGARASVNMDDIAAAAYPFGLAHSWQAVTCVENHDIVKVGAEGRLPAIADGSDRRSWYARSRSRVAVAILLTMPGMPQMFMGQELLDENQWNEDPSAPNLGWKRLDGGDAIVANHLRFTQDAVRLRREQPALRSESARVFHVHNANRVMAYHRWVETAGHDVVVVASLNDDAYEGYAVGFPFPGRWVEVFNSDVYEEPVTPRVGGNGGVIDVDGGPMHGFQSSCPIVIPANGVVVFARDPAL